MTEERLQEIEHCLLDLTHYGYEACDIKSGMENDMRELLAEVRSQQAHIDALMLEFCPDEMTPQQKATWAANQKPVPEGAEPNPETAKF